MDLSRKKNPRMERDKQDLQNLIQAFHPGLHEKMDLAASDNYVYFHMTTWGKLKDASSGSSPPVSFARTVGSNAAALNMGWRTMAQCRACHLMSDSNFWSSHERSNCAFSKRPASATPEETTWQNVLIISWLYHCDLCAKMPSSKAREVWVVIICLKKYTAMSSGPGSTHSSQVYPFAARGTLQASCWASIAPHCPPPSQWNEAALHCWRFGL